MIHWMGRAHRCGVTSLDYGTLVHPLTDSSQSSSAGYAIWCREFKSGHVEVSARKVDDWIRKGGSGNKKPRAKRGESENTLENRQKAERRARRRIRHCAHQLEADHLLTLTFRENITDLKVAWVYFRKFSRKMREHYGLKWQYVVVPEYQKRGAVHFHLAINGYWPVTVVRRFWWMCVGPGMGNVDIAYSRKGAKHSPSALAGYLSKYVSKAISHALINAKSYNVSQGIKPPTATFAFLVPGYPVLKVMREILEMTTRKRIKCVWFGGEERLPVYFMST